MVLNPAVKEGRDTSQASTASALRFRVVKVLAGVLADRQSSQVLEECVDTNCQPSVAPLQTCRIPVACFGVAARYLVDCEGSIVEADQPGEVGTCVP
jgi:hypothetical protein